MENIAELLKSKIRDIPDFPRPGIVFKDLTPVLQDAEAFQVTIEAIAGHYEGQQIDQVLGIESRGFIFGAALALHLGRGLSIVRKLGKLPWETIKESYDLEYGSDHLEIHRDGLSKGQRVLVVDDLLATGGTASAAVALCKRLEAEVVGTAFVVELGFLEGRKKLEGTDVFSLLSY